MVAKKRLIGITLFGYSMIIFYGFIVISALWELCLSIANPELTLNMLRGSTKRNYYNLRPFYIFIVQNLIIYAPQLVCAQGVLKLKEWARKLLVFINIALIIYIFCDIAWFHIIPHGFGGSVIPKLTSFAMYVSIVYYFTLSKVKEPQSQSKFHSYRPTFFHSDLGLTTPFLFEVFSPITRAVYLDNHRMMSYPVYNG